MTDAPRAVNKGALLLCGFTGADMPGKIFVNYRRDDERSAAARVRDRLAMAFGKSNVFMDVDNLKAGQRFDKELEKALAETDIFLAVMGPRWMELYSQRQASGERDYVHEEIAAALKRGIVVIPVLIERAALPRGDALPEDIRELVLHQKHTVVHEQFGRDVDGLIEAIRLSRTAAAKTTPSLPKVRAVTAGLVSAGALAAFGLAWLVTDNSGAPVSWPRSSFVQHGTTAAEITSENARTDADEPRQRAADIEIEKKRQARAKADLDAKVQGELELRQMAEPEAKRKADEAERQRVAKLKAEEEKQRVSEEQRKKEAAESKPKAQEEVAKLDRAPSVAGQPTNIASDQRPKSIQKPEPRPKNSVCNYRCFYGSKTGLNDPLGRAIEKALTDPAHSLDEVNLISELAIAENPVAQYIYGMFFLRGSGMPFSANKATSWLRRAADNGNALARLEIARLYRDGEGVPRNPFQALKYFKLASEQDVTEAAEDLARIYEDGDLDGVPASPEFASSWRKLADQIRMRRQ